MTAETARPYPSPVRAWIFVAVLFVASIVSVIDRAVLNIVVDPVKAELHVSDVQIALLQGLAFGLFYAAVGLPLGLGADRHSRRGLILIGMSLWSCATIGGGLVRSFGGLFLSRILVGLGEAALAPAALSLIGDLFPPDRRGRPISVFLMGQALAIGLSISVTGLILQAARAGRFAGLPLVAGLAPWRVVFVFCGLAGLGVLALMLATREPARRGAGAAPGLGAQVRACAGYMARNWMIFLPFYLGFAFCFAAAYGSGAWTPTMLIRQFGATGAELAQRLGPLSLVFSVLGPLAGGLAVDRFARRGAHRAKLAMLSLAPLAAVPSAFATFAPGLGPAIPLVAASGAVTVFIGTVTFAALQVMTPSAMRGVAVAITGLVNTVIGATLGPLLVAEFTQHLYRDPALVGRAIVTLAAPALVLSAACYGLAFLAFSRQLRSGGEVARAATAAPDAEATPLR